MLLDDSGSVAPARCAGPIPVRNALGRALQQTAVVSGSRPDPSARAPAPVAWRRLAFLCACRPFRRLSCHRCTRLTRRCVQYGVPPWLPDGSPNPAGIPDAPADKRRLPPGFDLLPLDSAPRCRGCRRALESDDVRLCERCQRDQERPLTQKRKRETAVARQCHDIGKFVRRTTEQQCVWGTGRAAQNAHMAMKKK